MSVTHLTKAPSDGTNFGQSITDKIGFYGLTTPIIQPTSTAQAAVTVSTITTAATTTSPWGFATSTQANNLAATAALNTTLLNQIRTDLVALNLIKGS